VLPEAPRRLAAPATFSPSSLDDPIPCALRVLAATKVNRGLFAWLPPSPSARLGTITHDILRQCSTSPDTNPSDLLRERLQPSVDLIELPPEVVRSVERFLTTTVERYGGDHRTFPPGPAQADRIYGHEVWLSSDDLRLAGAADLVRKTDTGEIEIVDYKTGHAVDAVGQPLRRYVVQLQAYALLLLQRVRGPVRLTLFDGQERSVRSDPAALAATRHIVAAFADRFPVGATPAAEAIATPGAACWSCGLRPSCSAYLEVAPVWWRDVPEAIGRLPPDTWGEVVKVVDVSDESVDVDLTDAAGRRVRVAELRKRDGVNIVAGSMIWAFGLIARATRRGFHGERPHPRLFQEMPTPSTPARAWTAVVFVG
jgi:hypothetical protein